MRIAINALALTNFSGRAVLRGHLRQLAATGAHQILVLHHAGNQDLVEDLGSQVEWRICPPETQHWARRAWWESVRLPAQLSAWQTEALLNPTGSIVPGLKLPQLTYAMNPWALVDDFAKSRAEQAKAWLQRRAYANAVRGASAMLYLSAYMERLFADAAGAEPRHAQVIYTGLEPELYAAAGRATQPGDPRNILSVSVMAPHKDVETLVQAVAELRRHYGVTELQVTIAGPWASALYEQKIRALIAALDLTATVEITGALPRADLLDQYRQAGSFCLMSRCESFGIPAVEAQAFATPVVSSNACAIPEVCGAGGLFPQAGDVSGTAAAVHRLIEDGQLHEGLSIAAQDNAARFEWQRVSAPLLDLFAQPESWLP